MELKAVEGAHWLSEQLNREDVELVSLRTGRSHIHF